MSKHDPKPADINDRQRFQQQYAEIATLAGGLAHEIRNPLSTIRMNVELLSEDLRELDDPRQGRILRKVELIHRECLRLEEILNAFLQFARAGELDRQPTDLGRLVSEYIDFYLPEARQQKIDISPHLSTDLPPVSVDQNLLRLVLVNLARNAQQAMPSGGLLEFQTFARDDQVCLEIIDNGLGMNAAAREKLFQVFFSTKPNGSGLGLPTVRKIVEAHGGTITCDSEPGRGTRFTIALPAAVEKTAKRAK